MCCLLRLVVAGILLSLGLVVWYLLCACPLRFSGMAEPAAPSPPALQLRPQPAMSPAEFQGKWGGLTAVAKDTVTLTPAAFAALEASKHQVCAAMHLYTGCTPVEALTHSHEVLSAVVNVSFICILLTQPTLHTPSPCTGLSAACQRPAPGNHRVWWRRPHLPLLLSRPARPPSSPSLPGGGDRQQAVVLAGRDHQERRPRVAAGGVAAHSWRAAGVYWVTSHRVITTTIVKRVG